MIAKSEIISSADLSALVDASRSNGGYYSVRQNIEIVAAIVTAVVVVIVGRDII
jgi:hypothetical protein